MDTTPSHLVARRSFARATPAWAVLALLAVAGPVRADPTLVTHLTQNSYQVDVRAGSDLLAFTGYSGAQVTGYSTAAALTGSGIILQSYPGEYPTLRQQLKLHFTANPGYEFSAVDFSHVLSFWMVEGGFRARMSWVLDRGDGSVSLIGATPWYESGAWYNGGTFSDATQASPALEVQHRSFDLDVTLDYQTLGYPGGCSSASGVCAAISAAYVKVWAPTTLAPVPEPATWALWLVAAGLAGWRWSGRAVRGG